MDFQEGIGLRWLINMREGYTAPFPNRASVHEPSSFFFVETTYSFSTAGR